MTGNGSDCDWRSRGGLARGGGGAFASVCEDEEKDEEKEDDDDIDDIDDIDDDASADSPPAFAGPISLAAWSSSRKSVGMYGQCFRIWSIGLLTVEYASTASTDVTSGSSAASNCIHRSSSFASALAGEDTRADLRAPCVAGCCASPLRTLVPEEAAAAIATAGARALAAPWPSWRSAAWLPYRPQ